MPGAPEPVAPAAVAGRALAEEQAVDAADAGDDRPVGEAGAGRLDCRGHVGRDVGVVGRRVGDEVVGRGPDEETPGELVHHRVGDEAEGDQVDALDGRAGEVLRARGGAAGERGVVLVLVDADGPHAVRRRRGDAAGAGRSAGAEDHVGALADELGGVGRALGRVEEAVVVDRQHPDVGVHGLRPDRVAVDELDHRGHALEAGDDADHAGLAERCGEDAGDVAALVLVELHAGHVRWVLGQELVDADEVDVGIGDGGGLGVAW